MDFLDDLRDSRTTTGKLFLSILVLLLLSLLVVLAISGFVLHGVLWPDRGASGVDPKRMLSPPDAVSFTAPGGRAQDGWLFPGLRTAPVIILCHGYGRQRSDLLTLITPLQEHQYNVFVFDFSGHGSNPGSTTLGPRETATLLAAIEELSRRSDLDNTRFGLWGTDMGGYAALAAAASDARVKAVAADSVYNQPIDFVSFQVERSGTSSIPLVSFFSRQGYRLLNWSSRNEPPLASRLAALAQTAKLFIQGRENAVLADATLQLFLQAPEPRAQAVFPRTDYPVLPEQEKKEYESQLLSFFLQHLPAAAPSSGR